MPDAPVVTITGLSRGTHDHVRTLNGAFTPGVPLLRLGLHVSWHPADATAALAALEADLNAQLPSWSRHQCGGPHAYRVSRARGRARRGGEAVIEAPLALAHLIEHAIIDVIAWVSGRTRVAGVTGARADAEGAFDVFVECGDDALVPLVASLVPQWVAALAGGYRDGEARAAVDMARLLFQHATPLRIAEAASALRIPPEQAADQLHLLEMARFARRLPDTLNFSGLPRYAVAS